MVKSKHLIQYSNRVLWSSVLGKYFFTCVLILCIPTTTAVCSSCTFQENNKIISNTFCCKNSVSDKTWKKLLSFQHNIFPLKKGHIWHVMFVQSKNSLNCNKSIPTVGEPTAYSVMCYHVSPSPSPLRASINWDIIAAQKDIRWWIFITQVYILETQIFH